jgi:hypothetical protein
MSNGKGIPRRHHFEGMRDGMHRRMALASLKGSPRGKRKDAGWDGAFMASLITG